MNSIPRAEYPNPQFQRNEWLNLNGKWQFEIDNGRSGTERKLFEDNVSLSESINVPFCPESELSGLNHKDFMYGVWYKRTYSLTEEMCSGKTLIHFGAVDFYCVVYINGVRVGDHKGGYVSFDFDITEFVKLGDNTVTVYAEDNNRDPLVPRGKQSEQFYSNGCSYTRTTGIWQTVWLEFMPRTHINRVKFYPDIDTPSVTMTAFLEGKGVLDVKIFYDNKLVGSASVKSDGGREMFTVLLSEKHLWEVGQGRLYDVCLSYGEDRVSSYFGLREVRLDDFRFLINGKSVFQRLILDQGFYPDGIYTAPSDEALLNDIKLSVAMGFNGARLHQKVFEQRFLYHCDKMGYIVWGEYADWGLDCLNHDSIYSILPEWEAEVERDFNHPSIIGWCPHNETRKEQFSPEVKLVYDTTKFLDTTRPCIDTSGWTHVCSDIYDLHNYNQFPDQFKKVVDDYVNDDVNKGKALFVSEYGGTRWNSENSGWGYGDNPKSVEELTERICELTKVIMENEKIFGLCYTQLTDVEQEQNGLYTYDRKQKFNPQKIKSVIQSKAAIED